MDERVTAAIRGSGLFANERVLLGHDVSSMRPQLEGLDIAPGLFKWAHYFEIYRNEFRSMRPQPKRILEIGVYKGASLRLWRSLLGPEAVIVGLDVDPECARYADPAQGVFIEIGDQADPAILRAVAREYGPLDIIIDDGGHSTSQQIISFAILYPEALVDGGIYLVEDVHTNYWTKFRDSSMSFLDLAKELVDRVNEPYRDNEGSWLFRAGHPKQLHDVDLSWFCRNTTHIAFYDSIVVVEKRAHPPPMSVLFEEAVPAEIATER